jgi:hypothetical protein
MRIPEILVQTLIWLPVFIAFSRGCRHRLIIVIVCGAIAASDLYDFASYLSHRNARHSMYLFMVEVLAWLPTFILSIYARKPSENREEGW